MPYDLYARLKTSDSFIKKKKIRVLVVTSLSSLFQGAPQSEVIKVLSNIVGLIDSLTLDNDLITLIANPAPTDPSSALASSLLSEGLDMEVVS